MIESEIGVGTSVSIMLPLALWDNERLKIMVYLVLYGQTDWNLLKMFNGITETESNETGLGQLGGRILP